MAKTKVKKTQELEKLESALKKAKSFVLIDYFGLKVKEISQLRKTVKSMAGQYLVTKKTILKLALKKLKLPDQEVDKITGGLGLIFGYEDELTPAKLAVQFANEYQKMKISGGFFDGRFIDSSEVKNLAKLPGRKELLEKLVWTVKSPLSGLVNVLDGNLRALVYALNEIYLSRNK
jgi:large subunit ribosomal protein L10